MAPALCGGTGVQTVQTAVPGAGTPGFLCVRLVWDCSRKSSPKPIPDNRLALAAGLHLNRAPPGGSELSKDIVLAFLKIIQFSWLARELRTELHPERMQVKIGDGEGTQQCPGEAR